MTRSLAAILVACTVGVAAAQGQPLKFYWAAQAETGTGAARQSAAVAPGETYLKLANGDGLQFYLSPEVACFAYLLGDAPNQPLRLLYPAADRLGRPIAPGAGQYVPSRGGWFRLDQQSGDERVYVLVGLDRLVDLEQAWLRYEKASDADKPAARRSVLEEISRARKAHAAAEPSTSRPIALTGRFRSAERDLAADAQPVAAGRLFARTYILEHRH